MELFNNFLFLTLLLFIKLVFLQKLAVEDEKPFLRIIAPQYICDSKENLKNSSKDTNNLTIGLQTREGQRLKYLIKIDFTLLDGFKSQRHTLSVWKNVRELESKFHEKSVSNEISLKNQIEVSAFELTPQVIYTFKIIGYDENKIETEEQYFNITYKGDKLKAAHTNIGDGISLLLYGPETIYNDMEFLAVADVIFCNPINDFHYEWKIKQFSEKDNINYVRIKGGTLKLPKGVLEVETFYEFSVTIFNNKSEPMASVFLPIKVISNNFLHQNVPVACSIGINKESSFMLSYYRNSPLKDFQIVWRCSENCSNVFVNETNLNQISTNFPTKGSYFLESEVFIKSKSKTSKTKVTVDERIIPRVEFKYFPQLPINIMQNNEFVATIMDLVPKCTASWIIVTDDHNYAKPKNENLSNFGEITITNYEEHFLQELVDYDNNTISKDIVLAIPYESLISDVNYKFRLNIICPEPLTDTMTSIDRKNISSFFDIVISTNKPPEAFPLKVFPEQGVPMKDIFTFKTGAAKDQQSHYPLKYTFGYHIANSTIIIGTFYEYQVAYTQLPYSDEIHTFYIVSDNNNASVNIIGPKVKANVNYNFTKEEINFKLSEIKGTLKRSEYSKTINSVATLILTQKKFAISENENVYETIVYEMIKNELDSLKSSISQTYVDYHKVVEFVKLSKYLISIMKVYDEAFIESVLSLTEPSNARFKRMALSNGLRNKGIMTPDPEYIKNILNLSDLLVSSSNSSVAMRERKKYIDKIHQFVKTLCYIQNLNSQIIESKFAIFEVSRIYSRQLFDEPQKFSHESTTIIYSPNSAFPGKFLCIGKIRYMLDMFDANAEENDNSIYETRIFDENENNEKVLVESETIGDYFIMETPLSAISYEITCLVWLDGKWNENLCEKLNLNNTSKIACKCKTSRNSTILKYGNSIKRDKNKQNNNDSVKTKSNNYNTTQNGLEFDNLTTIIPNTQTEVTSSKPGTNDFFPTKTVIDTSNFDLNSLNVDSTENPSNYFNSTYPETKSTNQIEFNFGESTMSTEDYHITNSRNSRTTVEMIAMEITTATSEKIINITEKSLNSYDEVNTLNVAITKKEILPSESPNLVEMNKSESNNEKDVPKENTATSNKLNITSLIFKKNETDGKRNSTLDSVISTTNDASINWIVISLLGFFFLIIFILIFLHRLRRLSEKYINLPIRYPSTDIKYAKYHDEFIMRG